MVDDELNVLPLSSHIRNITPVERDEDEERGRGGRVESKELREVKESLKETQPIGSLVELTKSEDQARAGLIFFFF